MQKPTRTTYDLNSLFENPTFDIPVMNFNDEDGCSWSKLSQKILTTNLQNFKNKMLSKQNTSSEMPIYFEKVGEIKMTNGET